MRPIGVTSVAGFLLAASLAGCASLGKRAPDLAQRTELITSSEIARSSSSNVWDLLRHRATQYNFAEDGSGRPRFISTRRGRSTILLAGSDSPLVLIDGARLIDVSALRDMPTDAVESIELKNGISGTSSQGTNAVAGVIYIHTWEASTSS